MSRILLAILLVFSIQGASFAEVKRKAATAEDVERAKRELDVWSYAERVADGHRIHGAMKVSYNSRPTIYGSNYASLILRHMDDTNNILVMVGEGVELECDPSRPYWLAKFDDGPNENIACANEGNAARIHLDVQNIERIKKAQHLTLEVRERGSSAWPYRWHLDGLKWPY
ncbi:hypothetical protein V7S57_14570 [Caulobacter sp. CCNWLY153]|uniref:hypothetical protein n=1 Tax=Caulobacter TaxID=75 RepID=UPI0010576357|nr:hypothetical protein [Caulobacter radicis]